MTTPRGIWYESGVNRNRWRVRVYRRARVIHLSYHDTLEDAIAALNAARAEQRRIREADRNMDTQSPEGRINALATGLV